MSNQGRSDYRHMLPDQYLGDIARRLDRLEGVGQTPDMHGAKITNAKGGTQDGDVLVHPLSDATGTSAIGDVAAFTNFTIVGGGGETVTIADLNSYFGNLLNELAAMRTIVNNIITALETAGVIPE